MAASTQSPELASSSDDKNTYFGYGSNMWRDQMSRRCSDSEYVGVGVLDGWKWIINTRGYATIVPSQGGVVYGLLYGISQSDMDQLDIYEGYPDSYIKEFEDIQVVNGPKGKKDEKETTSRSTLVYIDVKRKQEGPPKTEYIHRMNKAIADAVKEGVPQEYIDKYLRKFIPEEATPLGN